MYKIFSILTRISSLFRAFASLIELPLSRCLSLSWPSSHFLEAHFSFARSRYLCVCVGESVRLCA